MRIAIICALEEELESIITAIDCDCAVSKYGEFEVHTATYHKHELAFILCGIGKVNAAMRTQLIIDKFAPQSIINVGVAGGLDPELTFGDVVVANDLIHHDMDVSAFGIPLGQIPRMDVFAFNCSELLLDTVKSFTIDLDFKIQIGRIATGDQFIDNAILADKIYNTFNAIACEMEGAAVAQVCYVNRIPFLVVRALSDRAGTDSKEAVKSYDELKQMVAKRASLIVRQVLLKI